MSKHGHSRKFRRGKKSKMLLDNYVTQKKKEKSFRRWDQACKIAVKRHQQNPSPKDQKFETCVTILINMVSQMDHKANSADQMLQGKCEANKINLKYASEIPEESRKQHNTVSKTCSPTEQSNNNVKHVFIDDGESSRQSHGTLSEALMPSGDDPDAEKHALAIKAASPYQENKSDTFLTKMSFQAEFVSFKQPQAYSESEINDTALDALNCPQLSCFERENSPTMSNLLEKTPCEQLKSDKRETNVDVLLPLVKDQVVIPCHQSKVSESVCSTGTSKQAEELSSKHTEAHESFNKALYSGLHSFLDQKDRSVKGQQTIPFDKLTATKRIFEKLSSSQPTKVVEGFSDLFSFGSLELEETVVSKKKRRRNRKRNRKKSLNKSKDVEKKVQDESKAQNAQKEDLVNAKFHSVTNQHIKSQQNNPFDPFCSYYGNYTLANHLYVELLHRLASAGSSSMSLPLANSSFTSPTPQSISMGRLANINQQLPSSSGFPDITHGYTFVQTKQTFPVRDTGIYSDPSRFGGTLSTQNQYRPSWIENQINKISVSREFLPPMTWQTRGYF